MPKNPNVKRVMVIGSGPIVIGQAAEFDYAGTQACRSLKEEGVEVILVNSNPATIMTDKNIADKVYIEPLTAKVLEQIIEKEKPDLCAVVQDAVRGSRRLGLEKEIEITAELDKEAYLLDGDYGRLRQMLMIFLHNSIKFSPARSSIEVVLEGTSLKLIDHGCGMKAEDVPHAFDRFYKARNEQNKSGSGLGLAIAKQIALRHDMELTLESELGKGTVITVQLPPELAREDEEDGKA